jgi:hypothetical protein
VLRSLDDMDELAHSIALRQNDYAPLDDDDD